MTSAPKTRESTPSVASAHDKILIVDFGSQVTQLIARRVREAGVYSEIAPFGSAETVFARMQPKGVILSGSPASVLDADGPPIPAAILESHLPCSVSAMANRRSCTSLVAGWNQAIRES